MTMRVEEDRGFGDVNESHHNLLERIQARMAPERQNPNPGNASPILFYIILAVIVAAIAAFLVLRPHPARSITNQSPATLH